MKEIVVWSGGADSTCILNRLAKKSSKQNPVSVYVITTNGDVIKQKKELEARTQLLKEFKKRGYHIQKRNIDLNGYSIAKNQPITWLCGLMPYLQTYEDCNIHFGYIYEDSFWHMREHFVNAFYSLFKMSLTQVKYELFFDLEWTHKNEVLAELKNAKLLHLIWTCEHPTKTERACGKCDKCKELRENK